MAALVRGHMTAAGAGSGDLVLQGITRRFGSVVALAGVDLRVHPGEMLTILGPSGSGKTTMLKVVAGFELPDEGSVQLAGRDVTYAPPAQRDIGMVFQNYALFPHMTVAENIAFPLKMRRVSGADIKRKIEEALKLVELAGYGDRLPRQLSGGQQQRVALARAVVFGPRLLLLDEPFGALDRKLREQMQLEVKRLQRRLGLTALFVTHDQEEALILSDRIAVMNRGKLVQIGTPQEIYARPVDRFVGDFIGESNLFRARATQRGVAVVEGSGVTLRIPQATDLAPNAEVGLLVRPERPRPLAADGRADNVFSGTIDELIYLGESVKYRIQLEAGFELVVRWPFKREGDALAVGDRVTVGWSADDVHLVAWS
jgi:putative spermidine/putrescine transport system ATP-binding protein